MYKLYKKIDKLTTAPAYFAVRQWDFHDDNVQDAYAQLSAEDKETFKFDISAVTWESYMMNYYMGMRQFILKDEISTIPQAKIRYARYISSTDATQFSPNKNEHTFSKYFNWRV